MKVHWTDAARDHLRAIHAYIARSSPRYALHLVDRLTKRSQQIAEFPLSGREVAEFGVPQIRQVLEGPFRIIYYIKPDQIDVLAVIHGAQQIPPSEQRPRLVRTVPFMWHRHSCLCPRLMHPLLRTQARVPVPLGPPG